MKYLLVLNHEHVAIRIQKGAPPSQTTGLAKGKQMLPESIKSDKHQHAKAHYPYHPGRLAGHWDFAIP
jgi:hypothetical protein